MKLELAWFDPCLAPNRQKGGWRKKSAARKTQRTYACLIASTIQNKPHGEVLAVNIVFHPPDRRKRDLDNCLAAMKGAMDGIADALQVDDRIFRPITIDFGKVTKGGKIIIEINENSC
jgi:crossover junction endodeoxyribonuclease RusA